MLEKLVNSKKTNFTIDLNDTKNYTCWVLKEKNKDPLPNPHNQENKNIISYGAVGLYLQKMEKRQFEPNISNSKYYEIKFSNLISDIFPFERNPEINFMYYNSQNENLFGENHYENKRSTYGDKKMDTLRKKMINDDIPEMILYKYKYDKKLFKDLMEFWEDEPEFIYNLIKENRRYKHLIEKEVIKCIKDLINKHKVELFDIPYIVKECHDLYNNIFKEEEVFAILSLYDALYIQFKIKQIKIQKLHNQLILTTNNINKIDFSYTNDALNMLDLNLALSYIGYSISILNFNSKKKFCDNLMDLNINLNSKKLLQSTLEDECDKIVSKFCLSPEDVAFNLKVLNKEINDKLKEPNKDCQLMDLCTKKVLELIKKNKRYHPLYLLQKAINYYIISLSCHPYIAKLIFHYFLFAAKISTYPTEKGKLLLNYENPSYKVKNIKKQELSSFIDNMKNNEQDFSELYLDIEKCEKEGLIKCEIEIDMTSKYIQDLIKMLNTAVNGLNENVFDFLEKNAETKSINMSDSDESEINKIKVDVKKNSLVRKIAIKNMILDKVFIQKYFINSIKNECHNIAEKYLIEKISNKFYEEVLIRKHIKTKLNEVNDNNKFYYSIFFINSNTFCYIAVDKNKKIKYKNILKTYILSNDKNELRNEMETHIPKYIILGINNSGAYKIINYFEKSDYIIYSDYLSLLKIPKEYNNNFPNEKDYYYTIAYDQFKYTMNPLEFFIENYNFKYEKNLILNLRLHYLQEQINDIPLLNYCLEMQIRRSLNLYKFKYEGGKNPTDNYYCFMNGLGPLTSKLIDDYKNRPITELKNVTGDNILKNIYPFIHDNINSMCIEDENNFLYHFQDDVIFNKMINSFHIIKINSIHNVFVKDVDEENKVVNCILFFNENVFKCILPFLNIDNYITDINSYFQKYRILLCKIKNLQIDRSGIKIVLSNKIKDLEYLENYSVSRDSYIDSNEKKEEDKIMSTFILKNIINTQKNKGEKYLKKINEEDNNFIKNIILSDIKKDFISPDESGKFCFRPSYQGVDNLILTLSFSENLTLNYNIAIENEDKYILQSTEYKSLNDIVKDFANPLLKTINKFKQNKYFKSPQEKKKIFDKIFNNIIESNSNSNKNKENYNDNINVCFVDDSPNYGILITKNKNNSILFDFIELTPDGFIFHNKLFDTISLIIEYYLENNDKQGYKEFVCENIISDIHSKLEYIDLQYKEFSDKILDELNWEVKEINNDFEQGSKNENEFLEKKRKGNDDLGFDGWGNNKEDDNQNKNENNFGNNNINEDNDNGNFWSNEDNNKNNENNNNIFWSDNNSLDNKNNNNNWNNNNNDNSNNTFWTSKNDNNNNFGDNKNNNNNNNNNNWNNNNNNNNRNNNYGNNNNSWEKNRNKFFNKKNDKFNNNNNNYNKNGNNNRFNSNKNNNNFKDNNKFNNNNKFRNNNRNNPASKFSWTANNDQYENNNNEISEKNNEADNNDYWTNISEQDKNNWGSNNNQNNFNNNNNVSFSWGNDNQNNNNNTKFSWENDNNNNSGNNWNNKNNNNNKNNFNNKSFNSNFNNSNNNKIYNCSNDNYYPNVPFNKNGWKNNSFQFSISKKNSFKERNKSHKFNRKKGNWANEWKNEKNRDEIKSDENQGPIDFENVNAFGGYNVNSDEQEKNNDKQQNQDNNNEFW